MIKIKKWAGRDMNLTILMGVTLVILIWSGMAFGQSMYSMRNIQSMTFQIRHLSYSFPAVPHRFRRHVQNSQRAL